EALAPHLRAGQVISLESTTWPGTTEEIVAPLVQTAGLTPGTDCAIVYSPEREDPGNARFDVARIPKVVAGLTERCREIGRALYGQAVNELVEVRDTRTAEMVKLL
ncbi:MAG: UDP-N-acetyl-D-glucosamine dehydrogenase, partial [Gammaproteobacteria bacterium]|nr:UDP-N-acetyl-D-glucosamine dehydrogenase [Gammaproteobacteria bacterium]NIR92027.1 UDP-N-acetyl-D-glucosamine dehydrogenase [Gammaproteobacteria bacterium]NIW04189.1 UDP-N-acetyl-D-glucosamine dehydrogenase [Gammaproteobacteria bacterium]